MILLWLLACPPIAPQAPPGSVFVDSNYTWARIDPPPGAPEGTQCWSWWHPGLNAAYQEQSQYGGPVCRFPEAK